MNQFNFSGNLCRDPELKYSQAGKAYTKFAVAVARPFNRDETDFFNVTAFGKLAELIAEYTEKGMKVLVSGRVEITKKDSNTYVDVIADSVEWFGSKQAATQNNNDDWTISDDSLPF